MRVPAKSNSRRVNDKILDLLFTKAPLSKPEIRKQLGAYNPAIVNTTLMYLIKQRVMVETDDGRVCLNKDVVEV